MIYSAGFVRDRGNGNGLGSSGGRKSGRIPSTSRQTPIQKPKFDIRGCLTRLCLLLALCAHCAFAQSPPKESPSASVFDTVTRWLTIVGEKTENLLAPRFGHIGDAGKSVWEGLSARTRTFEESYPVRPACVVSITRDVGEGLVRIAAWDNPVVRVHVTTTVGAETGELAQELADNLRIDVSASVERVDIKVSNPATRDSGKSAVKLDYEITVPTDASVTCKNDWGDTDISGVAGEVVVDSRFGALDLRNLGGPVRMRAWGEFPLRAYGLRQGGAFELQGTQSEFVNVSGALKISNFMGSVAVRELPAEIELDVTCESGPIELFVPENATPEISASTAFGVIASDINLDRVTRGNLIIARGGTVGSKQRLSLHSSFNVITIHQEGVKPPEQSKSRDGGEFVRKNVEQAIEAPPGAPIAIKAVAGDVKLTPTDVSQLTVRAALVVQMEINANAQAAMEALDLRCEIVDGRAMVTTAVRDNMAALGCTRYRIDLDVLCPRQSPVSLNADSGFTMVSGLGAPLTVEQGKGTVTLEQCKREAGELRVTIQEGDVTVTECTGPLTVTTQQGSIKTLGVTGKQVLTAAQGRVTVELPKGDLVVRNAGGDAMVLAYEGVQGNFDIGVEKGDINFLVPDATDATLFVNATRGQVNSKVRLNGSVQGERREFSGALGAGTYRVDLGVTGGMINID